MQNVAENRDFDLWQKDHTRRYILAICNFGIARIFKIRWRYLHKPLIESYAVKIVSERFRMRK
jgi:hypothetical protein